MHTEVSAFIIGFACLLNVLRAETADTFRGSGGDAEEVERRRFSMLCMDVKPDHSVNMENIMGMWYGSEIIMHTQDVPGVHQYESCVVIHLSDATAQMQMIMRDHGYNSYRRPSTAAPYNQQRYNHREPDSDNSDPAYTKYLRLVWTEGEESIEYSLNYTTAHPGLWTNVIEQRGTLVSMNRYNQFSGTVQVVKWGDYLVLTFCGSDVKSSIYTILLNRREEGLSTEIRRSVHKQLSNAGLHAESIRKVCSSGAIHTLSALTVASLLGVCCMLRNLLTA